MENPDVHVQQQQDLQQEQQRRRQQQLMLWSLLSLLLLWMVFDTPPPAAQPSSQPREQVPDWMEKDEGVSTRTSRVLYPANLTGNFSGTWERVEVPATTQLRSVFMPRRAKSSVSLQADLRILSELPSHAPVLVGSQRGTVSVWVSKKSTPMPSIVALDARLSVTSEDGARVENVIMHGLHLQPSGEMILVATPGVRSQIEVSVSSTGAPPSSRALADSGGSNSSSECTWEVHLWSYPVSSAPSDSGARDMNAFQNYRRRLMRQQQSSPAEADTVEDGLLHVMGQGPAEGNEDWSSSLSTADMEAAKGTTMPTAPFRWLSEWMDAVSSGAPAGLWEAEGRQLQRTAAGSGATYEPPQTWMDARKEADKAAEEPGRIIVPMAGYISSPNCGVTASTAVAVRVLNVPVVNRASLGFFLLSALCLGVQLPTTIMQLVRVVETQTQASRLSVLSLGMMLVFDTWATMAHLATAVLWQPMFIFFFGLSLIEIFVVGVVLMRVMLQVWKARNPVAFANGMEVARRELGLFYARFYGAIGASVICLWVFPSSWEALLVLWCSFFVAQIAHNVHHNSADGMHTLFLLGSAGSRALPLLYLFACPFSFFSIITSDAYRPALGWGVFLWMALQTGVLLLQRKWGPRFFIPAVFLPKRYDYFRPVDVDAAGRIVRPGRGTGAAFAGGLAEAEETALGLESDEEEDADDVADAPRGTPAAAAADAAAGGGVAAGDAAAAAAAAAAAGGAQAQPQAGAQPRQPPGVPATRLEEMYRDLQVGWARTSRRVSRWSQRMSRQLPVALGGNRRGYERLDRSTGAVDAAGAAAPELELSDAATLQRGAAAATGATAATDVEEGDRALDAARDRAAREVGDVGSVGRAEPQARELTCSVCLGNIDLPLRRGEYMVTPCSHLFHTECLRDWMEIKMECPICRRSLPETGDSQGGTI